MNKLILLFTMVFALLVSDSPYAADLSMALNVGKGTHHNISDNQVSVFAAVDDIYQGVGLYGSVGIGDYDEPQTPGHVYDMDSLVYRGGLTWDLPLNLKLHTGYAYTYNDYHWYKDHQIHKVTSREYGYDVGLRYEFEGNGTLGLGFDASTDTTYLMAGFHL